MKDKSTQTLANEAQARASNPLSSVWVSASAGSGKTKVLKDRVLRLLLQGVSPHKIICLTFTKAAAGEMANRINESLKEWSICSDEKLIEELKGLTGKGKIEDSVMHESRKLFATILDNPLNIQNLHSFCQKVLKRFPLEAEISPHFEVIDEAKAGTILKDSIVQSLHNEDLSESLNEILSVINEAQFDDLTRSITSHKNKLFDLNKKYGESIFDEIYNFFDIKETDNEESLKQEFLDNCQSDFILQDVVNNHKDKTFMAITTAINIWLDKNNPAQDRTAIYQSIFLTQKLEPNKNTLKLFSKYGAEDLVDIEAKRCWEFSDKMSRLKMCKLNEAFFKFALSIIHSYEDKKDSLSVLDYNDLIFKTLRLLEQANINPWVMFKLDGGIDHILVDEAQDTSPELWDIIRLLTEEFFVGKSLETEIEKTLFVVGDEKQSIYSFQGADLHLFQKMKSFFADKIAESKKPFSNVPMNVSFRSLPTILEFVDKVFLGNNNGVSQEEINHTAFKEISSGYVEVWDHIEKEKNEEVFDEVKYLPTKENYKSEINASEIMAKKVASKIEELVKSNDILPATNQPIKPQDILILMKSRKGAFLNFLYKELKQRKVPVEGADRFKLKDELLDDDFVSLIKFLLMPDDDLSLAEVLKSPLINISEEELFALSYGRKNSLWSSVLKSNHATAVEYLKELFNKIDYIRPYEFINHILNTPCPNDEVSGKRAFIKHLGEQAKETIEELLNTSINFEQNSVVSMQSFLHELVNNSVDIAREFDKSTKVKIMTIHGAKGLEAPIVFMPDTVIDYGFVKDTVFWNSDMPLWIPNRFYQNSKSTPVKSAYTEQQLEEYKRLLYVALTRAEDRLYIGSFGSRVNPASWGALIRETISNVGEEMDGGYKLGNTDYTPNEKLEGIPEKPQTKDIDKNFLYQKADEESTEESPKSPSSLEEQLTISPFAKDDSIFFKRGLIIHKLLEILPSVQNKKEACQSFLNNKKHNLSNEQASQIEKEVLSIFDKHDYLFGENSSAEVPIVGKINDVKYSGVIDRLCITEDEVIIVDYKSNRPPAETAEDTPESYKKQLKIYKGILSQVYPYKNIKTAILWTNISKLLFLDQQ